MRRAGLTLLVACICASVSFFGIIENGQPASAADGGGFSAWSWGNGRQGELGDGTTDTYPNPAKIDAGQWKSISAGKGYSIAVKQDGSLWFWGEAPWDFGTKMTLPQRVGDVTSWTSVDAGGSHVLALRSDGSMWSWGLNASGQIGNGTTTDSSNPVRIGQGKIWKAVAAGYRHSVALASDNSLWAWGANDHGQVGDSTNTNRTSPKQIGTLTTWATISSGGDHTVALRDDGTLWAWGGNSAGEIGDGTSTNRATPTRIGTAKWKSISGGSLRSSGVQTGGTLWTWGTAEDNKPTRVGTETDWDSVVTGQHSFAFKSDSSLWAWGSNGSGELGDGTTTYRSEPVMVGPVGEWIGVGAASDQNEEGYIHSLGIKADGSLWSWGNNEYGQLGNGKTVQHEVPGQMDTSRWSQIASGEGHALGIKADGSLWVWGDNEDGQLGTGGTGEATVPTEVIPGTSWVSVAAGDDHSLAIRSDGSLWAWGDNTYGQLGDGSPPPDGAFRSSPTPEQVGAAKNWKSVAASGSHSLAIRTDGTLWAWGNNFYGQVGDGSTTHRTSPVQVGTATDWKFADGGDFHSLAIKNDGRLFLWGDNYYGQLGDGTTTGQTRPKALGTSKWVSASAGGDHNIAVRDDGALLSWGRNSDGQLGDGTTAQRSTPGQVGTAKDWLSVSAGRSHSLGLKSDGALSAWGDNYYGQLGDGTTDSRSAPKSIGTDKDWKSAQAGVMFSIGLRALANPPPTTTTVPPTTTTVPPTTTTVPPTTTTTVPTSVATATVFAAPDPVGSLDVVQGSPQGLRVAGWAIDPDVSRAVGVHIYLDGTFVKALSADTGRPDVGSSFAGFGDNHGYDTMVTAAPGPHSVCTYGINEGPGTNTLLGCISTTLGTDPFGAVDVAAPAPGGTMIAGWAIDPGTADPIDVHIYVDGNLVNVSRSASSRPDVAAAFPSYGSSHGFGALISLDPGFHVVCVYGINDGSGTNSLVGCRWVVASHDPFGSVDMVSMTNSKLRVAGWAIDPDTAASIDVHVYVDGIMLDASEASFARSDVAAAYPAYGASHGYEREYNISGGSHQVCVYGISKGAGSNALIACRST